LSGNIYIYIYVCIYILYAYVYIHIYVHTLLPCYIYIYIYMHILLPWGIHGRSRLQNCDVSFAKELYFHLFAKKPYYRRALLRRRHFSLYHLREDVQVWKRERSRAEATARKSAGKLWLEERGVVKDCLCHVTHTQNTRRSRKGEKIQYLTIQLNDVLTPRVSKESDTV